MTGSFGIDHPLLATHDIAALRARLIALGFAMTAIGKHPWGTSTSLAMFDGCLLEIMGIYDPDLIDEIPAGDFRFGRHVFTHLQDREGIALTALHSIDAHADAARAAAAGRACAGHLEFGRDVTLPDGRAGRTKTSLALLPDPDFPRLSFFLCQQHRPELIYVPEWLNHPNSVHGICGVTIVADLEDHGAVAARLSGLYGPGHAGKDAMEWQTANGRMRLSDPAAFERHIGPLPAGMDRPCIAAMDLVFADRAAFLGHLTASKTAYRDIGDGYVLTAPDAFANTYLRFFDSSARA